MVRRLLPHDIPFLLADRDPHIYDPGSDEDWEFDEGEEMVPGDAMDIVTAPQGYGGAAENSEVEGYKMDDEIVVRNVEKYVSADQPDFPLRERDVTASNLLSTGRNYGKEDDSSSRTEDGIDAWVRDWLEEKWQICSEDDKELAKLSAPVVKDIVAQESDGLFTCQDGYLVKGFEYRSTFRTCMLEMRVTGLQLVDVCLGVMFARSSGPLKAAFARLTLDGRDSTLDLRDSFRAALPASAARREVGIYLRRLPGFRAYVGISTDIARRQSEHDKARGNKRLLSALGSRRAVEVVTAKRLICFGQLGICDMPAPVLYCLETLLIGAARTTSGSNSIQCNLVDRPPYRIRSQKLAESIYDDEAKCLVAVWTALGAQFEAQEISGKRGYFGEGFRPLPISADGLLFAQGECDRLLGPVLEQNKFKRYSIFWVLSNLFRRVAAQDSQGKVTSQSPYPELEEAKRRHPIPESAFYKGTDIRYALQASAAGISGPSAHYIDWTRLTRQHNNKTVLHATETGQMDGMFGDLRQSALTAAELDRIYWNAQSIKLWYQFGPAYKVSDVSIPDVTFMTLKPRPSASKA